MEESKPFYRILDEICKEQNIEQTLLSYGWIRELKKEDKRHYIIRYQFDLNSAIAYNIASDKFATYEVLRANNIPTIEHRMIFNPKTRSMYYKNKFIELAKELLVKNDNKVVIKANDSCEGKDVYFCTTEKEIEEKVRKLFIEKNDTLSACPYLDIDFEYRAIYLYGEIIYIYKKRKAYVIGDGIKKLKDLIGAKYSNSNIDLIRELDLEYIPKKGEEITICWKHNLYNGAEPVLIDETDEFVEEVKKIAVSAGKAINIKFASIDIAVTSDKKVLVMEINGSVCMNKFTQIVPDGYKIAKKIYSKAINKMFE
ncbi:MAG TPA: hypothetical protein IAD08_02010 [Candidatus Scatovivens faecipullorum]|nr:hypothetical protein [Candidatus Scatovivens faecipullorum]